MARRMTKEQLDEQFEQFLKESVSDDSVDLGGSGKHSVLDSLGKSSEKPAKKTAAVTKLWWQDEDDSEEGLGREKTTKRRFVKIKKSQTESSRDDESGIRKSTSQAASVEEACKPVPKARSSKALEAPSQSDKVRRATEEVPVTPAAGLRSPESNSGNLRSPVNESPRSASVERSCDLQRSDDASLTSSDSDSQGSVDGLLKSGKTFRKSLRMSQPIQEEEEQPLGDRGLSDEEGPPIFSRDSLEPEDSLVLSGQGLRFEGMGTLDEEVDKERFFAQLEDGASSPGDYSRLNRESDDAASINLGKAKQVVEGAMGGEVESGRVSPASPHYSEDFEDEGSGKEVFEEKPVKPSMLSKVSLHDSLNSTGGIYFPNKGSKTGEDPRKEDTARSLEADSALPVQSYGQSGGSEFEALQEAYRQISHLAGEPEGPEGQLPHRSSPERREGSPSPGGPTSPVDRSRGTLQRSTTESELPTAEELMKPIRPEMDHTRGFALQSDSNVALQPEKPDSSMEKRAPVPSPRRSAAADPAGRSGESRRPTPPGSPEALPWSIREEVHRLMHDGDSPAPDPIPHADKAKKRQAPQRPAGSSTSTLRKPTVASSRGRRPDSRLSTLATRFSGGAGGSRPGVGAKPPSPLSQRRPQSQLQPVQHSPKATPRPTGNTQVVAGAEPGLRVSSELVASVQSFAAFLQQQVEHTGPPGATMTPQAPRETHPEVLTRGEARLHSRVMEEEDEEEEEGSPLVGRLRLQLAQREQEVHLREERLAQRHKEELNELRQEIYVMQSKLRSAEGASASRKERWGLGEPVTEERLLLIQKEMKEQEVLIQGYHQENEKLYLQLKSQQAQNKLNQEAMFTENQRLLTELASTKEPLNKSCALDHTERVTQLLGQLHTVQRSEARLREEAHRLQQEKQALHVDLQLMKRERDQVIWSSGDRSFDLRAQEERHREEVASLKKRLQWYAENQELVDGDAARLRTATSEIQKLTEQVEKLKSEVGRRNQQQTKTKERAAEAKKIQDLERQVKQLEETLRRRHPNSIPALIHAAASAAGPSDSATSLCKPPPTQSSALLERRIQRLEAELESSDEASRRSLRAMEQQYQRIKLQYEQQISELEQQLARQQQPEPPGPSEARLRALEEELERGKESHQSREEALQAEVQSLQEQLALRTPTARPERAQPSPSRHQRQAEEASGVRIERLNQELAAKSRAVQELTRTVERLQRERKTMLCGHGPPRPELRPGEAKRLPAPSKAPPAAGAAPGEEKAGGGVAETFPPTQDEKDYQPTAFSGCHISEVLQENEELKERLERTERQGSQEILALQAAAAQAQAELRRAQESLSEQLSSLRADHRRELEGTCSRQALEQALFKVAQLTNQLSTQEVMLQHLREQLKELHSTKEDLSVSRIREETLQHQLSRLLEELKQAKASHSPELRHFHSLERKISNMELRHAQREKELQQLIGQTRQVVEAEQQSEVERWRAVAQGKTRELEAFRLELDSILDILRELQRQGVVIPSPEQPPATVPFTWRS